jgi:EAL domain-containing protein (putative c-di-GMP-specific phosphodiesterase class I)
MRMLLVDDSEFARRAYREGLSRSGIDMDVAASAKEALARVNREAYDVIVSDVNMPGMSGIDFLKAIRQIDLDLPVVLTTGSPTVETAAEAVEYGAYRYLPKSVRMEVLEDTLRRAERYYALAKLKRYALASAGSSFDWPADRAALEGRFDAALGNLWIAFQPIVSWPDRRVHGYEILVRSHEGSLQRPVDLLEAAERLGRLVELGRGIRAQAAAAMPILPADATVFVNLHPVDLNDPSLYDDGPLAAVASRIVLEITERASLDGVSSLPERLLDLRARGFRLAVDDLGAGYAGLSSMAHIEPEYVKLDMSLIRGIDERPTKQKLVRSMAHLCDDLGMHVVAEGIETAAERDALGSTGCELLQGYLFARPESRPPAVRWE